MKLFNFSPKDNLNEVIFQNRNKEYGAYVLRKEEGNILKKALFFGIASVFTLAIIPLVITSYNRSSVIDNATPVELPPSILRDVDKPDIPKPDIVKTEPVVQNDLKVVQYQIPTPKKIVVKEKTFAKKSDMEHAALGFEDKAGKETKLTVFVPDVNVPTGPKVDYVKPEVVIPLDENKVFDRPDVEAKFPGGIDAFRNQVSKYFNQDSFDGSGDLLKTTITFIVEKDGSISNITANGSDASFNKEAIKTVGKIKSKFMPAQQKGKNVRYAFKMPIAMQFD